MVNQTQIRTSIQKKIFTPFGLSTTLRTRGTPTYNERGEAESVPFTTSTITVVPYDMKTSDLLYQKFGEVNAGDMFVAIAYSVTIAVEDRLTIDSQTWEIKEITKHFLPGNLVYIVRISKVIA